jgi:hypothetical protein
MIIEYKDFVIELIDDKFHTLNSVDNINTYGIAYCQNMATQINSKHGIKIIEKETEISSAIVCSDGLSTTTHPTSYLINNDVIFVCCGRHVYALDIPSLRLNWVIEFDPDTCLEIYPFEKDFIIHGESNISRGTVKGDIVWSVFVNLNGHKEFEIFDGKINSIYKLCRYIDDKQNESSKDLKRLITLDELSEDFWNVSNLTHFAALFQPLKYLKKILIIVACLQRSSKEITSCNLVPYS